MATEAAWNGEAEAANALVDGDRAPFVGRGTDEQSGALTKSTPWANALLRAAAVATCLGAVAFGASRIGLSRSTNTAAAEGTRSADPAGVVSFADHDEDEESSWLPGFGYVHTAFDKDEMKDDYEHGLSVEKGDLLMIAKFSNGEGQHHWYFGKKVYPKEGGKGFVPKWAVDVNSTVIKRAFKASESQEDHKGTIKEVHLGDAAWPQHNHKSGWTWTIAARSTGSHEVQSGWVPDWALHGDTHGAHEG